MCSRGASLQFPKEYERNTSLMKEKMYMGKLLRAQAVVLSNYRVYLCSVYFFPISIIIFIVPQTDFVKIRDHSHGPAVACLLISWHYLFIIQWMS